jgi:hypothetical protein
MRRELQVIEYSVYTDKQIIRLICYDDVKETG